MFSILGKGALLCPTPPPCIFFSLLFWIPCSYLSLDSFITLPFKYNPSFLPAISFLCPFLFECFICQHFYLGFSVPPPFLTANPHHYPSPLWMSNSNLLTPLQHHTHVTAHYITNTYTHADSENLDRVKTETTVPCAALLLPSNFLSASLTKQWLVLGGLFYERKNKQK